MNKLLIIFYCCLAVACNKSMPPVEDIWAAERVNLDMISSDSGTKWKVDKIFINHKQWNADSSRYYDIYYDTLYTSGQQLHFKNLVSDTGTYITTDTVAHLLRIPLHGKFSELKGWHTTQLTLKMQRDTANLQVGIDKMKENGGIIPGKFELLALYQVGDILYRIALSLSP